MVDDSGSRQADHVPDEELAAEQGIIVEQLQEVRGKVLAKVYAYILSWDTPSGKE